MLPLDQSLKTIYWSPKLLSCDCVKLEQDFSPRTPTEKKTKGIKKKTNTP